MPCYSPLKGWKDPETGGLVFKTRGRDLETMEVACSQCLGCRLDRSRMWAMRLVHEAHLHDGMSGSCFVTLTYRPKHEATREQKQRGQFIPDDWSLDKRHFQKFVKRLRIHLQRNGHTQKIKFFHCGEYGRMTPNGIDLTLQRDPCHKHGRPHYHACIFGWKPDDLEAYGQTKDYTRYTSPTLEKLWGYGFVDVGDLNFKTAAYTARYCLKKVNGPDQEHTYVRVSPQGEVIHIQPEYATMSNGIGREFYEKYKADFFPWDEVPVPGEGVVPKVPRYYEEILKEVDPQLHEEIKEKRQQFREENQDEYTPERLFAKYQVKKAQVKLLRRNVE